MASVKIDVTQFFKNTYLSEYEYFFFIYVEICPEFKKNNYIK